MLLLLLLRPNFFAVIKHEKASKPKKTFIMPALTEVRVPSKGVSGGGGLGSSSSKSLSAMITFDLVFTDDELEV